MDKEQLIKEITDEVVKYVPNVENFYYKQQGVKVYRNITLEDILIAGSENQGDLLWSVNCIYNKKIMFITHDKKRYNKKREHVWQLGKPLHEQSVETLQFIRDILK